MSEGTAGASHVGMHGGDDRPDELKQKKPKLTAFARGFDPSASPSPSPHPPALHPSPYPPGTPAHSSPPVVHASGPPPPPEAAAGRPEDPRVGQWLANLPQAGQSDHEDQSSWRRGQAWEHYELGSPAEKQAVKEAKEQVMGVPDDAFPNVKNVRAELDRGFRFWALMMLAVRSLRQSPSSGDRTGAGRVV
ncbi:hypothetical protein JCM1840_005384 [Sporobolomyces johnsonii]